MNNLRRSEQSFERAAEVIAYWRDGIFVLENFLAGTRAAAPAVAAQVLALCSKPRSVSFLRRRLSEHHPRSVEKLVDAMVALKFLQAPTGKQGSQLWDPWNPAAGFFHFSTKDVRFPRSPAESVRLWKQRGPTTPMPAPTKSYANPKHISLPASNNESELARVLLSRRTWREFSNAPLKVENVATILNLTWGVQKWGHVRGEGNIPLKTSPSGGARHPGEVYVYVRRVRGLVPGLYHYAAAEHHLVKLPYEPARRDFGTLLPAQPWYGRAAALFIMTAVFERSLWRYNFPRAYRAVLIEAGHLCQTFCLVSTSLGLAPFCSMAFPDTKVEQILGIDGVAESALYIAGLGVPPKRGWRPFQPRQMMDLH